MFTRETLVGDLNVANDKVNELRAAGAPADEIAAATVTLKSIEAQISALDAREAAVVETAPEAPSSLGRTAADALSGAPVGTSVKLDRAIIADPFGSVSGRQPVTWAQQADYVAGVDAPVTFVDTLPRYTATSDSVTYIEETGFTNAAAARLAGSNAAESEITFQKVVLPVANVAHRIRIAEETLADNAQLSQVIDNRGVFGVRKVMNTQLLAASNATNGVKSVVAAATASVYDDENVSLIDAVLTAKTTAEAAGFTPSIVVMTPARFEGIAKAKTSQGQYLGAGPFGGGNGTLWGLRVVTDPALESGTHALVVDPSALGLYVRDEADVASDRDIVANMLTVRVQTRAQVAVFHPEGVLAVKPDVETP